MLKAETFLSPGEVVEFVNNNGIHKNDIYKLESLSRGFYRLWWWEEED